MNEKIDDWKSILNLKNWRFSTILQLFFSCVLIKTAYYDGIQNCSFGPNPFNDLNLAIKSAAIAGIVGFILTFYHFLVIRKISSRATVFNISIVFFIANIAASSIISAIVFTTENKLQETNRLACTCRNPKGSSSLCIDWIKSEPRTRVYSNFESLPQEIKAAISQNLNLVTSPKSNPVDVKPVLTTQ